MKKWSRSNILQIILSLFVILVVFVIFNIKGYKEYRTTQEYRVKVDNLSEDISKAKSDILRLNQHIEEQNKIITKQQQEIIRLQKK